MNGLESSVELVGFLFSPNPHSFTENRIVGKLDSISTTQTTIQTVTMNKAELIDSLAKRTGQTMTDTLHNFDLLLEIIETAVAGGDKLQLPGFGTFEPNHRAARKGRNPQTGEAIDIAESTVPKFTPGKSFKERVVEAHKPKPKPASTGKAKAKTEATTTDKAKAQPKKA